MLAQLYHTHHSRYGEDLPFWLKLAARQKGPILELGCGTGRVLITLARAGYTACGLDNDAGMLAVLQQQIDVELAARCCIFQADMAAFRLDQSFPLILLPCNTLSALPVETRLATLACVRGHLTAGGLFATSLPNPALLRRMPRRVEAEIEEVFPHPVDSEPVQVSSTWQRSAGQFTTTWYYDHLLPDGRVERFSTQVCHTLIPVQSYAKEFHQAGLQIIALYGDFDQSKYEEHSPSLIILAQPQVDG